MPACEPLPPDGDGAHSKTSTDKVRGWEAPGYTDPCSEGRKSPVTDPQGQFGSLLPAVGVPPPGPRSQAMAARLGAVESRNVTHLSGGGAVFWEAARGANVRDVDGNVYVDLTGAFGVAVAGHAHPRVVEAIREQAGHLIHGMGDVHPPARKVEFLEALARLAPWPHTRIVLGSSGSEAVEAALKTALLATGRPGIVAFEGAYHGLTLGALATTHREDFRRPFARRLYGGVAFVPFPGEGGGEVAMKRSLDEVGRLLAEGVEWRGGKEEVGAVLVEPIQGRGGVRLPPPGFLRALGELARRAGALLIFDEIFTGLGRTGRRFAFEHEGVVPDLLCLGKGLGGGLPLSACLGPREVMDAWPPSRGEALHTSTFLGHPLACGAGLAVLGVLEEEGLADRAAEWGEAALARLRGALGGCPWVREVRGRGLFLGVELAEPGTGGAWGGAAAVVAVEALRRGVFVLPAGPQGEVVELTPPLVITLEQWETALDLLAEVILGLKP